LSELDLLKESQRIQRGAAPRRASVVARYRRKFSAKDKAADSIFLKSLHVALRRAEKNDVSTKFTKRREEFLPL
jgi:hypothetical protein